MKELLANALKSNIGTDMECVSTLADGDVFDEDADINCLVQKDWEKSERNIRKSGYLLGLVAGKEESVQQGFDNGYNKVAELAYTLGRIQGQIRAVLNEVLSKEAVFLTKEISASIHILHSQSEQRGGVSVSQHHLQHVSGLQDQLASMLSSCLALQKFLQTQPCADKDDRFLDCHTYPEVALPQSVIECLASRSSETNSVTIAMPSLHDVEQSMADITAQMNSFCLHEFSDSFHIPIGRVQKLLEQVKMLLHAVLQTSISPSSSSSSFT